VRGGAQRLLRLAPHGRGVLPRALHAHALRVCGRSRVALPVERRLLGGVERALVRDKIGPVGHLCLAPRRVHGALAQAREFVHGRRVAGHEPSGISPFWSTVVG
jgi:hypothetical protein